MKCDCCGKKKGLLESFEKVKTEHGNLNLCVTCSNLLYKIRDAAHDENQDEYNALLDELRIRSHKQWFESFLFDMSMLQKSIAFPFLHLRQG